MPPLARRFNCLAELSCSFRATTDCVHQDPVEGILREGLGGQDYPDKLLELSIFPRERKHTWYFVPPIGPKQLDLVFGTFCYCSVVTVAERLIENIDVVPVRQVVGNCFGCVRLVSRARSLRRFGMDRRVTHEYRYRERKSVSHEA